MYFLEFISNLESFSIIICNEIKATQYSEASPGQPEISRLYFDPRVKEYLPTSNNKVIILNLQHFKLKLLIDFELSHSFWP